MFIFTHPPVITALNYFNGDGLKKITEDHHHHYCFCVFKWSRVFALRWHIFVPCSLPTPKKIHQVQGYTTRGGMCLWLVSASRCYVREATWRLPAVPPLLWSGCDATSTSLPSQQPPSFDTNVSIVDVSSIIVKKSSLAFFYYWKTHRHENIFILKN